MINSMTGFGRAELIENNNEISVEIRSVNNRFLDVQAKLPKYFYHLEHEVKSLVRDYVVRGRITVFVTMKSRNGANCDGLKINHEAVQNYWKLIKDLKEKYQIPGELKLEHLLSFSEVFNYDDESEFSQQTWDSIKTAIKKALEDFCKMRQKEGHELAQDLIDRIQVLNEKVEQIEKLSKLRQDEELQKLRDRVKELVRDSEIDDIRLGMEISLMMNRIDVTEECVRFRSHNKMFLQTLNENEAVGRKLNFLLQEMTREANTIGSKANHAEISHLVVDIKEEVEKIREQVQNIE